MTDFIRDLETELLAAAHRRAVAGDRPWWSVRRRPAAGDAGRRSGYAVAADARWESGPAVARDARWGSGLGARPARRRAWGRPPALARPLAALVAVLAVLAGAALVLRSPPTRPAPAPVSGPGGRAAFAIPAAAVAHPCAGTATLPATPPPAAVTATLGLLRRPPTSADALPALPQPLSAWLPVGDHDPSAVRRPGGPVSVSRTIPSGEWRQVTGPSLLSLRVVPTGDLREAPVACGGGGASRGPGACLVAGGLMVPPQWSCFTLAEIRAGRAFALLDVPHNGETLVGLQPDGPSTVAIRTAQRPTVGSILYLGSVFDNVVQAGLPSLHPGDRVFASATRSQTPEVLVLAPGVDAGWAHGTAAELHDRLGVVAYDTSLERPVPNAPAVYALRPGSDAIARQVREVLGGPPVRTSLPPPVPTLLDKSPDVVVILGRMR
jgi:hypothetical protein